MASRFRMQIIDALTEECVQFAPGHPIEMDFVQECVDRILAKGFIAVDLSQAELVERAVSAIVGRGVGWFKSEAVVKQAIQDGLREALVGHQLDQRLLQFRHDAEAAVHDAIGDAIHTLKRKVRP